MAEANTTLTAAVDANTDVFPCAAVTGATVGGLCKIDKEISFVLEIIGLSVRVRSRGSFGGRAVAHASGTTVTFFLASDAKAPLAGQTNVEVINPSEDGKRDVQIATADGAIDVTALKRHTDLKIIKAGVCALTLAAPSLLQDGLRLRIISDTANAHTVTYTAGFYADTTFSDVATFAAKAGASMEIIASGGRWGIASLGNVTLA